MIDGRIKRVMGSVFGVHPGVITTHSSVETIPEWDSVNHMTLLLALEQEFDVTFEDDDLPDLTSFGSICAAVSRLEAAA